MTEIVIKRLNKHSRVIDIFFGKQGWNEWARYVLVKIKGQNYMKFLQGQPLHKNAYDYVTTKLGV